MPHIFYLHTRTASPIINSTHESGKFFTEDEPTLTHHNYPKPIVYLRGHSWYCTVCGSEQNYNNVHPSLQYDMECSHCPPKPLTTLSSLPLPLATTDLSIVSLVLPFPDYHIVGILSMQISFFHLVICLGL